MSQQPKKLPPVATTSAVGVLLTAFVMAGVPAAILTYQDFASGNHDLASLLAIFGLALLSAISATGAVTVHNKTNVPSGLQDAIDNIIVPTLANLTNGMNATLSHVAHPPALPPIHISNIMPEAPQAPVQPIQQPYTPIMSAAATQSPQVIYPSADMTTSINPQMPPRQAPQFAPHQPPAQQPTDMSTIVTQSVPAMPAIPDPWSNTALTRAFTATSKQAQ
jgi:hypothetical protein